MSIATVDPQTYDDIFQRTIAHYINSGMDLTAARQLAKEEMSQCFRKGEDTSRDDTLDLKENGIYG